MNSPRNHSLRNRRSSAALQWSIPARLAANCSALRLAVRARLSVRPRRLNKVPPIRNCYFERLAVCRDDAQPVVDALEADLKLLPFRNSDPLIGPKALAHAPLRHRPNFAAAGWRTQLSQRYADPVGPDASLH